MGVKTITVNSNENMVQGFCPNSLVDVVADTPWQPTAAMLAFRVGEACSYKLNGSTNEGLLPPGAVTCIDDSNPSFTFNISMTIEVM